MSAAALAPPEPVFDADAFAERMQATAAQMADMHAYLELLTSWNGRINLVGPSAIAQFWLRHAYDSAQLLHVEQSATRWADIGAGAGFPGVVLAILLKSRPDAVMHLVDSLAKRVAFLEDVANHLDLPVVLHHGRAEAIKPPPGVQVVTSRACAPLPRLLTYTERFFRQGAHGLFLKGRDVESELTAARQSWKFSSTLLPSDSDPSGRILRIEGLSRA